LSFLRVKLSDGSGSHRFDCLPSARKSETDVVKLKNMLFFSPWYFISGLLARGEFLKLFFAPI
jgi:hypothetical protein